MPLDALKTALLDLLYELRSSNVQLILGGGYGLFLKQESLTHSGHRTLLPVDNWPQPRATNDLDFLLRPEIVTASETMATIREALDRTGFEAVESAKYYQFQKILGGGREVKIDFLAGPLGKFNDPKRVSIDSRRVKPKPSVNLHAHSADEAVAYDLEPLTVPVHGARSNHEAYEAEILIPQGFTYILMKLFAFRDRRDDPAKGLAQHHALDLYRVVAMLTEEEFALVRDLAERYREEARVQEAAEIATRFFYDKTALGILRMREHRLFHDNIDVDELIKVLGEFFKQA